MNVTLLGTASAEGWPGLFCRCESCARARRLGGKNIRTRSSSLIDGVLKIDFPPDILHQVIQNNLDLQSLKAVLFTHGHDDHFSVPELQYLGKYFTSEAIKTVLPIYGPPDVIERLRELLNPMLVPVALHTLQMWKRTCVAGYGVTPIRAQHDTSRECYNFLIQDESGTTLLYATDTGWYEEETWHFLAGKWIDGIVVECTKGLKQDGYMAHMCIPEIIRMRDKLQAMGTLAPGAPIVTTHHSHLCGMMHEELSAVLAPSRIQVGFDGLTFPLEHSETAPLPRHTRSVPPETSALTLDSR